MFINDDQFIEHDERDWDGDPRGLALMWEPPRAGANYVMAIDPTVGIPGWHRRLRAQGDDKTDNAAIEIIRVGGDDKDLEPDVQVCEYCAPQDVYDVAPVANLLGRLYRGRNEDGQALCIPEAYPGPGLPLINELTHKHGYTNIYVWRYIDRLIPTQTNSLGFYSSPKAVQSLWIRSLSHFKRRRIRIHSPWLVEECSDVVFDIQRKRGEAVYGKHDDRVSAINMAIWAANDWSMEVETEQTVTRTTEKPPEWQASAVTLEDLHDLWQEKFDSIAEE